MRHAELSLGEVQSLVAALLDPDSKVRHDGLRLFSSLDHRAYAVLDTALESRSDPDFKARANLMDGVLSCTESLNPHQTCLVLELSNDPDELVREKVIAFIGAVSISVLRSSIEKMEPSRQIHFINALNFAESFLGDAQALFDNAIVHSSIESTFLLSSLQRMARAGALDRVPEYSGNSYLARGVLANTQRLMKRASRHRERS